MKPRAMKAFKILAGLLVVVAGVWAAYRFAIRLWRLTWGAAPQEINAVQPGELARMCPEEVGPPPFHAVAIQPERALILGQPPLTDADRAAGHAWMSTWAFILDPLDANTTRLIVRSRDAVHAGWMDLIEPGVFLMESGMLRGIQARAVMQ
jgi:hypothetical protein